MREFDLLSHVYQANAGLSSRVTIPPGDDMGAIRLGDSQVLVTVDQVADGVHVDLARQSLARVGRKAITRNLSDVAAMGAVPLGAVAAASLPQGFGQDNAAALFDAMRKTAGDFDCPLFGGDVSIWPGKLVLTVTVLARAAEHEGRVVSPILRKGAKAGDIVCVTGWLGGSGEDVRSRIHHLDFTPRLEVGQALACDDAIRPSAMIDLSDGLSRDIGHLCDAAHLGVRIELAKLPLSDGAIQAAARSGKPAWFHALADGEDYELCMCLPPEKFQQLQQRGSSVAGVTLTAIGQMTAEQSRLLIDARGEASVLEVHGWEHQG